VSNREKRESFMPLLDIKLKLAQVIIDERKKGRLSQDVFAIRLGLNSGQINRLEHGAVEGMTVDRLMGLVLDLGYDVDVVIS
jgi:transcriptional regulator with XRE-family HTH domain